MKIACSSTAGRRCCDGQCIGDKARRWRRVGHVHLRVGDIAMAESFYRGTVGLDPTRRRSGASFLSSG
jgi:catechol-2,3-dioxygenase